MAYVRRGFKAEDPSLVRSRCRSLAPMSSTLRSRGPENPKGGEMTPLFFSVDDFRSAWIASGQPADKLPPLSDRPAHARLQHGEGLFKGPVVHPLIAPEAGLPL